MTASAACAPANYSLPGVFLARRQSSAETAWATLAATMLSWRDDVAYTEEQAVEKIGPEWVARYAERRALTDDETAILFGTLGLCTPPPQTLSSEAWEALLRLYGPIAIIDGDGATARLSTSVRIVSGVRGDGTMSGTRLSFVDTGTGDVGDISLERLGGPVRLLHWHADAGLGAGVKPTAPAPEAPTVNGTSPPVASESPARASSRLARARQLSTPAWDRPESFPQEIRAFWARLDSRLHHFVWHDARATWPNLSPGTRQAFNRLGFTAPPRKTGDAGSGVDFLAMHREMVGATRALAIRLGFDYRPLGWNPIPWEHADPVWPMPAWSGRPAFKTPEITAFWRRQVRDNLTNETWLAGVSLDELGQTIEEGIHNWMHMHWASSPPSNSELQRADPSNDWLGSTFTSQVNPVFWKLHGWIDECIERWENAPLASGGSRRSAASDLKRFNWIGPVPKPAAAAKSMGAHEHGSDISEAELQELVSAIDFTERPSFPFASLSRGELVARFGDVGEITVAELQEIEPPTSMMASVDGRRRIIVGRERHGVRLARPLGWWAPLIPVVGEKVLDWVLDEATSRADGSRFVVKTQDVVLAGLRDYQAEAFTRTRAEFAITTKFPGIGLPSLPLVPKLPVPFPIPLPVGTPDDAKFTLHIVFDHNGYNIRGAMILPLAQQSTPIKDARFEIQLLPRNESPEGSERTVIAYLIAGRWDPGGDRQYDFTGRLVLTAAGDFDVRLDTSPGDMVSHDPATKRFVSRERFATSGRTRIGLTPSIHFERPGSHDVSPEEEQRLKNWHANDLSKSVRYARLRNGGIPIYVEGYASDTGDSKKNTELSRKRAEAVATIVRGFFPAPADIRVAHFGERNPASKIPVEDRAYRRVDVYFEVF